MHDIIMMLVKIITILWMRNFTNHLLSVMERFKFAYRMWQSTTNHLNQSRFHEILNVVYSSRNVFKYIGRAMIFGVRY